ACCPAPILTTKAGGSIGPTGDASCGLAIRSYFPNALECEPLDQQRPPAFLLGACSGARIVAPPYNGAALDGCCRADDSCGFYDNVTGLGCLSASVFGISTAESCGGLL